MRAWPRWCLLWALLLATGAVTLIRCHSGGSGGGSIPPGICGIAKCLAGNHYDVQLNIIPGGITNFRRTGGCLAKTKGISAIYDGCILRPNMTGALVLEFKLCQIGSDLIVTVIDKTSADLYPAEVANNTLLARKTPGGKAEYEDCWTSQSADPPLTVETPCFADMSDPHRIGPDRFMVKGPLVTLPDGVFQFTSAVTQNSGVKATEALSSGVSVFPWYTSNAVSGSLCPDGSLTGGWTERIQVTLSLEFSGDGVQGTLLFEDRDPDRTATRQCLEWCPTYINPGGPNCPGGPVQRNFCPFANTTPTNCTANWVDQLRFYDLFPYCNPGYLTGTFGSCPSGVGESCGFFNLSDGTQPHTCEYAVCPPWVLGREGELREFPFCARVIDLPCDVGGTTERHCSMGIHTDNVIVGGGGGDAQKDMAAEFCNSLSSADVAGGRCFLGPAPCCNGAPVDTSWEKCRGIGVRPLSQPPFSGYAVPYPAGILLTDMDYKCPLDSPPPPARYRNRLLPFDCDTAYAENCPADDVAIEFNVSGTFTYREEFPSCP